MKLEFPSPLDLLPPPYPATWKSSPSTQYARATSSKIHGFLLSLDSFQHDTSPITLFAANNQIHWARIELPLMLFPNNSHLLRSQSDIDTALSAFSNWISPLLRRPCTIVDSSIYSRVDITLQIHLPYPVDSFLSTMRHVSHARRLPTLHPSGNITYGSKKSAFQLKLYDKALDMKLPGQGFLRIEFQLSKYKLRQLLGPSPDRYPSHLSFERCYSAFRSQILRFGVQNVQLSRFDSRQDFWSSLLAEAEARGWTMPDGRSYLDGLSDHYEDSALYRYRRRASDFHFSTFHFDWASEFPETFPPPHLAPFVPDPDNMERYSIARRRHSRMPRNLLAPSAPLAVHP